MQIDVFTNQRLRKTEYALTHPLFKPTLEDIRQYIDIEGDIVGVSFNGSNIYGIYMRGYPTKSPVNINKIETEADGNNLVQLKVDIITKEIECKVYAFNPEDYKNYPYTVVGSSVIIGKDKTTIYYVKSPETVSILRGLKPHQYYEVLRQDGFFSKTIENGIESEESHYVPANNTERKLYALN